MFISVIGALFLTFSAARAEQVGIPVTIQVTDVDGIPITTAIIRHVEEADRHRVNIETGRWTGRVLYLYNGDELVFKKDTELELTISAPGYSNASVNYVVKKRKNLVPVSLTKMRFALNDDQGNYAPKIGFKHDAILDK